MNIPLSIKKHLICVSLALILSSAALPQTAYAAAMTLRYDGKEHSYNALPISLTVNGNTLTDLTMPPVIMDGNTLVPAREVFESLGAVVDYKAASREVYIGYRDTLIILAIDKYTVNVGGYDMAMKVPPKIINDKTMIPVRLPAEVLGFDVGWNPQSRIVSITGEVDDFTNQPEPEPQPEAPPEQPPVSSTPNDFHSGIYISDSPVNADNITKSNDVSSTPIVAQSLPETSIVSMKAPAAGARNMFEIQASSAISKVEKLLLADNRLVLDIYNANNSLESRYTVTNPVVAAVRAAQNQTQPEKITRVVFDLSTGVNYSVSLSQDRTSIYVSFEQNTVTNLSVTGDLVSDTLIIECTMPPVVDIYPSPGLNQLIVDIPLTKMPNNYNTQFSGVFTSSLKGMQYDDNTARIYLEVKNSPSFNVTYQDNKAFIKLTALTVRNASYNSSNKTISIKKDPNAPIDIKSIVHKDLYNKNMYTFTIPGKVDLGFGDVYVRDENISKLSVTTNGGQTELTVYENKIFAFDITEDANNIYIKAVNPKEKYKKIVVIDPGHGGSEPGASGNGVTEKNINLDVSRRLMALLEQNPEIKAYATRTEDVTFDRFERAPWANQLGDMYVSIHMNSVKNNNTANGTEVYYYPHENDVSRYGVSSQSLAETLHRTLISTIGSTERKVLSNTYTVLLYTEMPAALVEVGFVSNPEEAAKLASEGYRQQVAQGLYAGITQAFSRYKPR